MGCDIHPHVEVKIAGKWEHYAEPNTDRDYLLFARLADVRNTQPGDKWYVEPISKPRGLPSDISVVTRLDHEIDNGDAHSVSWVTREEAAQVKTWLREKRKDVTEYGWHRQPFGYLFGNDFDDPLPEGIEDARVVFWFDN